MRQASSDPEPRARLILILEIDVPMVRRRISSARINGSLPLIGAS
jgi:hypothetical protein